MVKGFVLSHCIPEIQPYISNFVFDDVLIRQINK